jgi:hypothetical protein
MNKSELGRLFKDRLEAFLNVLIDQFPKEKDLVIFQLAVRGNMLDMEVALREFSKTILPHKHMVLNKNEDFFLTKCKTLLSGTDIKSDQVDHFKRFWLSDTLTAEDRENLWKWFRLFLKIATEYDSLK